MGLHKFKRHLMMPSEARQHVFLRVIEYLYSACFKSFISKKTTPPPPRMVPPPLNLFNEQRRYTAVRQILTSKGDPRAERVKYL